MSFFFEGNGYFDGSYLLNSTVGNTNVFESQISKSSIDMLDKNNNYQNITNVKDPINLQDAATKKYVDNLEIVISQISLSGTTEQIISQKTKGSYVITITNQMIDGPSAIFHVTKTEQSRNAHIVRTSAAPGFGSLTFLQITWPINGGIRLNKTNSSYDGTYIIKVM